METNGGDSSWVNEKNELHNRSINSMGIEGLIDSNKHGGNGAVRHKHQLNYIDAN